MQHSWLEIRKNKSKAAELEKCGFFFFPLDLSSEKVMEQEAPRALADVLGTT